MKHESTLIITVVLALTMLGVLMVYSTGNGPNSHDSRILMQLLYLSVGLAAMYFTAHFDYHRFADPGIYRAIVLVALLLLLLVLVPGIGRSVNGARRWIPVAGMQFQPSEFAKFAMILLLSVKLTQNSAYVHTFFSGFLPAMCIGVLFAGLVFLERDLGVPALMMGVTLCMLVVAGVRGIYIGLSLLPLSAALTALIVLWPHRVKRLTAFINPWSDRDGDGFHLIQSLMGFSRGGLWGLGAGGGEQKLGYLYAANTDFIFAVIGEELGLPGTLMTVALFAALTYACLRVAAHAQDLFGCLLASGITALLSGQAILVMMVSTGMLPTKGLPLPFISHGGTALVIALALAGILVNIAIQAVPDPAPRPLRRVAAH